MKNPFELLNQNFEREIALTPVIPASNVFKTGGKKAKRPYLRPTVAYLQAMRAADAAVVSFARKETKIAEPLQQDQYRAN
jgi:hypothetical protein